jgi:hypothetical protein
MSQRLSQLPTDAGSERFYRASGLVLWPYCDIPQRLSPTDRCPSHTTGACVITHLWAWGHRGARKIGVRAQPCRVWRARAIAARMPCC